MVDINAAPELNFANIDEKAPNMPAQAEKVGFKLEQAKNIIRKVYLEHMDKKMQEPILRAQQALEERLTSKAVPTSVQELKTRFGSVEESEINSAAEKLAGAPEQVFKETDALSTAIDQDELSAENESEPVSQAIQDERAQRIARRDELLKQTLGEELYNKVMKIKEEMPETVEASAQ